jgi:hypothetical protein
MRTLRLTTCSLAVAVLLAACSTSTPGARPGSSPSSSTLSSGSFGRFGGQASRLASLVRRENQRPGSRGWQLSRLGRPHEIEGWVDRSSVLPGERVRLHVSTTAPLYTVSAVRVGWYGGQLGRWVWHSMVLRGVRQAAPRVTGPQHLVVTDWPVSLQVDTAGWPTGNYLFRLDASTGGQRYVPLDVRAPSAAGAVVVVSADTTWQAYNAYGGYSLYHGPDGAFADRARAVSFDRPYGIETGAGASEYSENMRPLVSVVERLDLPADYVSDIDLDRDPRLLAGARAVVLTGHDEYWSSRMRSALLSARDGGANLAFLGANSGYRHVRFQPSGTGPDRVEVCYKIPAEDPLLGRDDMEVTGQWRSPPDPRPESVLTGVFYQSNPVRAALVVVDPTSWLLAGTGAKAGLALPGLVAPEYDRVDLAVPTPRPIEIWAHSPLTVHGRADFADAAYYTAGNGAGVFATGTIAWIKSLEGADGPAVERITNSVTTTVLEAFAAGPAGRSHPAVDNVSTIYPTRRR